MSTLKGAHSKDRTLNSTHQGARSKEQMHFNLECSSKSCKMLHFVITVEDENDSVNILHHLGKAIVGLTPGTNHINLFLCSYKYIFTSWITSISPKLLRTNFSIFSHHTHFFPGSYSTLREFFTFEGVIPLSGSFIHKLQIVTSQIKLKKISFSGD